MGSVTAARVTAPALLDVIPSFQRHLRAENKSPRTIKSYTEAVRRLHDFCSANGMPLEVVNIMWALRVLAVFAGMGVFGIFDSLGTGQRNPGSKQHDSRGDHEGHWSRAHCLGRFCERAESSQENVEPPLQDSVG